MPCRDSSRFEVGLAVTLLLAGLAAGCGSSDGEGETTSATEVPEEAVSSAPTTPVAATTTFTERCGSPSRLTTYDVYLCDETSPDPRFEGEATLWSHGSGSIFVLPGDGGTWMGTSSPVGDGTYAGKGLGTGDYEGLKYAYDGGPPTFTVTIEPVSPEKDETSFTTSESCAASSTSGYRYECRNTASDPRFAGVKLLSGNEAWTEGTFRVTNEGGVWRGIWSMTDGHIEAIGQGSGDYASLQVRFEGTPPSFTGTMQSSGADPAAQLYGQWAIAGGVYMTYERDGSWGISYQPGGDPFAGGTFTFDGEVLTYTDIETGSNCPGSETGVYEVEFTAEGDLQLSLVEDDCSVRANDANAPFVRYTP